MQSPYPLGHVQSAPKARLLPAAINMVPVTAVAIIVLIFMIFNLLLNWCPTHNTILIGISFQNQWIFLFFCRNMLKTDIGNMKTENGKWKCLRPQIPAGGIPKHYKLAAPLHTIRGLILFGCRVIPWKDYVQQDCHTGCNHNRGLAKDGGGPVRELSLIHI